MGKRESSLATVFADKTTECISGVILSNQKLCGWNVHELHGRKKEEEEEEEEEEVRR